MSHWVVHKFGGTCLADAERFRNAARIVPRHGEEKRAVVVSAMAGVTDALLQALEQARCGIEGPESLRALESRHRDTLHDLLPQELRPPIESALSSDLQDLGDLLRAVRLLRSYSDALMERVAGYGELWSAQLLHAHWMATGVAASWLDAREVLIVEQRDTGPAVDWPASRARLKAWLDTHDVSDVVVTGFIASTTDGTPTTLKRNGSDYSASIFASLFDAREITIWTDVDGAMSADPRRVPEAVLLQELSYEEAAELAYFGAKVLHPHTMAPAIEKGIPIRVRNAFRLDSPGTMIRARRKRSEPESASMPPAPAAARPVSGFSSVENVLLVNVQGTGMIGVPGIAHRLFGALREVGVSVVMISQASSEHSICFAVPEAQGETARRAVETAFFAEIHTKQVQTVELSAPCSILAAVGENMVETPGVAATFFAALAKAGVNVRAIAQGSSERNISIVVDRADSSRALRAAHAGFYLSAQTLSLGLVGPGLIGGAFLDQLATQADMLRRQFRIDLRLRAIAGSRHMLLDDAGIGFDGWRERFEAATQPVDLGTLADHVQARHLPHAVILDCTASPDVASRYREWLARGIHVVTPNKKANSGPAVIYRELRRQARLCATHYLYEATVGAGLPVISTLRDLVQTGDRVLAIEGVLSGTLSYIFNTWDGHTPFSEVVRQAKERGYTEPDPRDDLSGMDVARKLIILAREMGLEIELDAVPVESLVPENLRHVGTASEFLAGLPAHDEAMRQLAETAHAASQVLRHVGVIDAETATARVELRRYDRTHPFAGLRQSDNIILFRTARYFEQPLVVQGPGAGPQVTAGGVFADLLRLAAYLGAPS